MVSWVFEENIVNRKIIEAYHIVLVQILITPVNRLTTKRKALCDKPIQNAKCECLKNTSGKVLPDKQTTCSYKCLNVGGVSLIDALFCEGTSWYNINVFLARYSTSPYKRSEISNCLPNSLFMLTTKKTSTRLIIDICGESTYPHKCPEIRKTLPCHDIIMTGKLTTGASVTHHIAPSTCSLFHRKSLISGHLCTWEGRCSYEVGLYGHINNADVYSRNPPRDPW